MTEPLTIFTWFWKQPQGRTSYGPDTVNVWADMVRRNLSMPHRIACVTAHPEGLDSYIDIIDPPGDFEDIKLPTWGPDKPQCLRRIALFRPDAASIFGKRFVSMDMDSVVMGPLDPLFDRPDDFVMFAGTTAHRPYNGSMLLMTAGARPQVYEKLTPEGAIKAGSRFVGSDQAWISWVLGRGEKTWTHWDGVHAYNSVKNGNEKTRVLFFFGNPKPWDLLHDDRIADYYRRSPRPGKALILGGYPEVWEDAIEAMDKGPFGAVIAPREVQEHWPGPVHATASSKTEAFRKARMLGYEQVVVCDRQNEEEPCASLV
jgi:hypothetical protein